MWVLFKLPINILYEGVKIMKSVKKAILNVLAKVGMSSAVNAAGAASAYGYHQPKEPKALKKMKK